MAYSSLARAAALALAAATFASGCGGKSSTHLSSRPSGTTGGTPPATTRMTAPGRPSKRPNAAPKSARIAIQVPRHWVVSHKAISPQTWPRPLAVAASFPVHHLGANAACSHEVLSSMTPHGVFILVSEYTQPPPPGYPALTPFGTRSDLSHMNIRLSEVECWEGLSGTAHFKDHGRLFFVEVLFGTRTTAAERRRALDYLATFRVTRA
jgi:hypothetical protein